MKKLKELYKEHQGKVSDKWSFYLDEYERLFSAYRKREITLLEIGVQNGGSLEIWGEYFPYAKKIIGCDINPDCKKLSYEDPRITVIIGDVNSESSKKEIFSLVSEFDIIIDDGSHFSGDIIKSFVNYFEILANDGVYIVEDLHCSYWKEFEGGLYYPYSSLSFFKKMVDVINTEHWNIDKSIERFLSGFSEKYNICFNKESLSAIHCIELMNSMCVIHKKTKKNDFLNKRIISGSINEILPNIKELSKSKLFLNQFSNKWSNIDFSPEEQYLSLKSQLGDREEKLAERDAQLAQIFASRSWKYSAPFRWAGRQARRIHRLLKSLT